MTTGPPTLLAWLKPTNIRYFGVGNQPIAVITHDGKLTRLFADIIVSSQRELVVRNLRKSIIATFPKFVGGIFRSVEMIFDCSWQNLGGEQGREPVG